MSGFSRLPIQQIMVASIVGVLCGMYIFAPGIIEFSNEIKNKNGAQREQAKNQNGDAGE